MANEQTGSSRGVVRWRAWPLVGALVIVAMAGALVFVAGRSDVMHLEGRAAVGEGFASIEVDGWFYGVHDSVAWIDGSGSFHDHGWPECLRPGTNQGVRFGAVEVTPPGTGIGHRAVVYVDCRSGSNG